MTPSPRQSDTSAAAPAGPADQARVRTLTEALKQLDPAGLTRLLAKRPDLSYPLPQGISELSTRAGTPTSVARAMDQLNRWLLQVSEALAALPDPTSAGEVAALLGCPEDVTSAAFIELRERALAWGSDDQLHLVRTVREYFDPYPGGLAPPSPRPLTDCQISAALDQCDQSVHPLLERLLWSPTGAVRNADRVVEESTARSPVDQLLSRQLLRPLDPDTVILPREVALHLRSHRFSATPVPTTPPQLSGPSRGASLVDKAAAGAAFGLLHDVELAVHSLQTTPHRLLRTGGLSVRDLTVLARELSTDAAHASFVMECASIAGLVAPAATGCLLPTPDYDRWAARDSASQWRLVADAWLRGARLYGRSSEPGAHPLGAEAEAEAPGAPALRRLVLHLAVEAGPGTRISVDDLADAAAWHRPRAARAGTSELATVVRWTWREATWLGLLSLDSVSSFGTALLAAGQPLPTALVQLFPEPVEQFIVQADLTAVAPGPLPHVLASELRLLADQESRGGGGVYRFSAGSLRRGFEAGWSSAEMHSWLEQHSSTGIPQPLDYLINDMARQFGSIRIGTAVAYLRIEDEGQTAALLAAPEAPFLGLRVIAPGVVVSSAEASELVSFLRQHGHSPAVEDEDGHTVTAPPQLRAANPRREHSPQPPTPVEAAAAITASESRHSELLARRTAVPAEPAASTEQTLRELQAARMDAQPVRVSYVAADGQPTERQLNPLELAAGMMRAVDRANAQVLSIPLSRISSVGPVTDDT